MAYDLRDLLGVERVLLRRGAWSLSRTGWLGLADQIDRRLKVVSKFEGLSVAVDMHEEESRFIPEKVIVQSSHFQSVIEQGRHDRIDFLLG